MIREIQEVPALSVAEVLLNLNGGGTLEEIQHAIHTVTKAVQETGNNGSITIKLSVARNGDGSSGQIAIKDQVSVSMPKVAKPVSLFFVKDDGGLTRQNPLQGALSFGGPRG